MVVDKKKATKIQNINDGISAGSGIVALAVPEFSFVPLIVFGVNRILGFVSDDDIIKRLKKEKYAYVYNRYGLMYESGSVGSG